MAYDELLYDVSDHIATITLNRPDKLNAWTMKMENEYRHAMAEAEKDDNVRVIIVTGAGRGFCSGADKSLLSDVMSGNLDTNDSGDSLDAAPGAGNGMSDDFHKQYNFPLAVKKPILCAVNGAAVGLGFVHTLYCDIRWASDQAKFSTIFSQRGLVAEHGSSWMLPRIVGLENAIDLLYSGRTIDAAEAQRMGLVSRVVPHDQLMASVRDYATMLATQCSPRSLADMKREIYNALTQSFGQAYDVTVDDMVNSFGSEDFREGISSLIEKRPAQFTGK